MANTTRARSRIWAVGLAACVLASGARAVAQDATAYATAPAAGGGEDRHARAEAAPNAAGRFMGAAPASASAGKAPAQPAAAQKKPAAQKDKLPAFPRHPALYHRGATYFFLDCPAPLTEKQVAALEAIRDKSQKEMADADEKIARAEREIYKLIGAASPDGAAIAAAVAEIERTRAMQRITFIRRVGDAAALLDDKQRSAFVKPSAEPSDDADAAHEERAAAPPAKKRPAKPKARPAPEPADDDAD